MLRAAVICGGQVFGLMRAAQVIADEPFDRFEGATPTPQRNALFLRDA